jgi:hypothetical protein
MTIRAEPPLFLKDTEIARLLTKDMTVDEWKAKAVILEREGLPKVDPIMGGRFWPAVRSFFERQYGINTPHLTAPDGPEDFSAWNRTRHRASSAAREKTGRNG